MPFSSKASWLISSAALFPAILPIDLFMINYHNRVCYPAKIDKKNFMEPFQRAVEPYPGSCVVRSINQHFPLYL